MNKTLYLRFLHPIPRINFFEPVRYTGILLRFGYLSFQFTNPKLFVTFKIPGGIFMPTGRLMSII